MLTIIFRLNLVRHLLIKKMSIELQNKPLKKGKTLFLFDIDGSLCKLKLEEKDNMVKLLKTLSEKKI